MNCPKCGRASLENDVFCGECGAFLNRVATASDPETSTTNSNEATDTPELPIIEFGEAISRGFRNYVKFNGRATRAEYWWFFLFVQLVSLASVVPFVGWIISLFGSLALITPHICISVRRLHDIGKSGWWLLLWYASIITVWSFWSIMFFASIGGLEGSGKTETEMEAVFLGWIIWAGIPVLATITIVIWWIAWFVKKGEKGTNNYGLDPRQPS